MKIIKWLDRIFSKDDLDKIKVLEDLVKQLQDENLVLRTKLNELNDKIRELQEENKKLNDDLRLFAKVEKIVGKKVLEDLVEHMNT